MSYKECLQSNPDQHHGPHVLQWESSVRYGSAPRPPTMIVFSLIRIRTTTPMPYNECLQSWERPLAQSRPGPRLLSHSKEIGWWGVRGRESCVEPHSCLLMFVGAGYSSGRLFPVNTHTHTSPPSHTHTHITHTQTDFPPLWAKPLPSLKQETGWDAAFYSPSFLLIRSHKLSAEIQLLHLGHSENAERFRLFLGWLFFLEYLDLHWMMQVLRTHDCMIHFLWDS